MVRLGVNNIVKAVILVSDFNSTMVRLGGIAAVPKLIQAAISIPLWYDWGSFGVQVVYPTDLFQFHYGTIGGVLRPG